MPQSVVPDWGGDGTSKKKKFISMWGKQYSPSFDSARPRVLSVPCQQLKHMFEWIEQNIYH